MRDPASPIDRRTLLRVGGGLALVVLGAGAAGCKKALACTDTAGLSAAELSARQALQYNDHAADPSRACNRCRFFQSAGPDSCGHCTLVKGPINPNGGCNGFNART
ncbi:MAG: hypothetical protein JNK72_15865 [Myxococcales bacterium]|nr:hypothetical protein [Myxococcales bacterium]